MRIIIEEYKYQAIAVKDVLHGIDALEDVQGYVCLNYVGYFYNTELHDCVFILPKVLLEVKGGRELVFGKYQPEAIINLDKSNPLTQKEKDFIYEFAVWIYRTIVVFQADKESDTSIVHYKKLVQTGRGSRRLSNTFLDILLSLIQFNKDNQSFFFYILRNLHSGYNKINWTRTIGSTSAVVQGNRPIYLSPVNKKRQINFDEELLIIFFSILNYIGDYYGFTKNINCNFALIKGKQFDSYMNGLGKVRLLQIKYKYFSDKALEIWELCYAFFDGARQIKVHSHQQEYLLVKNFNIVFEAIIDELVGDKSIPKGLKEQEDGKRIDHMYTYKGLTTHEEDKPIYYIGDSKYYKRGSEIGKKAVYKQFTYARNVVQWNLNLFMSSDVLDEDIKYDKRNFRKVLKLRDDVTEGYNIIPNFFISARLNEELSYKEEIEMIDKQHTHFNNRQFENRLFDRDTLLICHYDVNFLYVVSVYARGNELQKEAWKGKVRQMFRTEIQRMLQEKYDFYAMTARPDVDAKSYFRAHFQQVLGKVYAPFNEEKFYSLALDSEEIYKKENETLKKELEPFFIIEKCNMSENPEFVLGEKVANERKSYQQDLLKEQVLIAIEIHPSIWDNIDNYTAVAVGLDMVRNAFNVVKNFSAAKYVLLTNRGIRDKAKMRLYKVKDTAGVVTTVDKSTTIARYYHEAARHDMEEEEYSKTQTPSIYLEFRLNGHLDLDAFPIDRDKVETTKTEGEDVRSPRVVLLEQIVQNS